MGEPAAATFVQRFGGALNLNVHFHAIVAEALFAKDGDAVQRIDLPQRSMQSTWVTSLLDERGIGV